MALEDIGSSDSTALLCHTNRPNINLKKPSHPHSGGNWFSPSNIRVDGKNTPGFRRNRGVMVVRLKQTAETGPANEGIYCCSAKDSNGVNKTKCAGVYNKSGGIFIITTNFLVVAIPSHRKNDFNSLSHLPSCFYIWRHGTDCNQQTQSKVHPHL